MIVEKCYKSLQMPTLLLKLAQLQPSCGVLGSPSTSLQTSIYTDTATMGTSYPVNRMGAYCLWFYPHLTVMLSDQQAKWSDIRQFWLEIVRCLTVNISLMDWYLVWVSDWIGTEWWPHCGCCTLCKLNYIIKIMLFVNLKIQLHKLTFKELSTCMKL